VKEVEEDGVCGWKWRRRWRRMRWRDLVEEVGGGSGEKWREEAGQGQLCC